jgi:dTDP-4-amino-4,6-dideoxygalactose transaminase
MEVPFLSLKKLNKAHEEDFKNALEKFIDSGHYILGESVKEFESAFAQYCESAFCVGVANGLDALILILESFNFPSNSEVIVPANTYFASILAILRAGLKPVLVEPSLHDYLVNAKEVSKKITDKTTAVLAVNLYGRMCNFTELQSLCTENSLKLIIDAAQSHGAEFSTSKNCIGADAVAYSFYPTKNLGALADAGAVVTDSAELAEHIKINRNYGSGIKYQFDFLGQNSRLSELQAMFLSIKLKYLDSEIAKRRNIAAKYLAEIKNEKIVLPPNDNIHQDAWHLFVIRTEDRNGLAAYLKQNGIGSDIHYPIPPHKQKALNEFNGLSLPITEEIHETILSIPMNSTLSENEVDYIISTLNAY